MDHTTPPLQIPARRTDSHKGTFGRVLVVAGSRGMTGAAILCGAAALRGGAGLVQVACPVDVQDIVALGNPCYLTAGLPVAADGTYREAALAAAVPLAEDADVLAIGPGLGHSPDVIDFVRSLLLAVPAKPAVVDADGLRAFIGDPPIRTGPTILTPHPGEFARLVSRTVADVQANREGLAKRLATQFGAVVLLKGAATVVTDGNRLNVNPTGNPGMATGGTGDVLTGLIAAFLGQGLTAFDAATLGAWVHGRAGDVAADDLGQTALTAADVLGYLPAALRAAEPE